MAKSEIEIINPEPAEIIRDLTQPFEDAGRDIGIDEKLLARRGRQELDAKAVRVISIQGRIEKDTVLPKGYKVIGVFKDSESEVRTLVEHKLADMGVRHKARQSFHDLYGHKKSEAQRAQNQIIIVNTLMPKPDPPPNEEDPNACISGTEYLIEE
jgi:hypothetical protein